MSSTLAFATYCDVILESTAQLREESTQAGLSAPVPTCPQWNMGHLLAHQGMVHRWALDILAGREIADDEDVEREGLTASDPAAWLQQGCDALVDQLRATPSDAEIPFFMGSPLSGRDSWARRMSHETAIHSVDAFAARLGYRPTEHDIEFDPAFAVDGVDELLCSYLPRPTFDLRSSQPATVVVHTTDTGHSWLLSFSAKTPVAERDRTADDPDAVVSGTAVGLYLTLWNRGNYASHEGRDVLALWRDRMKVT